MTDYIPLNYTTTNHLTEQLLKQFNDHVDVYGKEGLVSLYGALYKISCQVKEQMEETTDPRSPMSLTFQTLTNQLLMAMMYSEDFVLIPPPSTQDYNKEFV